MKTRASALILNLLLLTLLTILIVGFITSVRMDIAMSRTHREGIQAGFLCRMGSDAAMARMTTVLSNTAQLWTSQPGALLTSSNGGTSWSSLELSSGSCSSSGSGVDLNRADLESGTEYPIASAGVVGTSQPNLYARWIYVNKDGSLASSATTTSIGRFAFWVDDESTKVNMNTAWKRTTGTSSSYPLQVSLSAAGFSDPDAIHTARQSRDYNTLPDFRAISGSAASVIATNGFYLTAYNHTPNRNIFGEPRIVLTTQKNLANGGEFLDILANDNSDPGTVSSLSSNKLNTVIQRLSGLLKRTDWPICPGKSFAAKFSPIRIEQIAVNIIEYVRARESSVPLVEPIRGELINGAFALNSNNSVYSMMGNNRGVRITEAGFYLENGSAAGRYRLRIIVELHLPKYAGLASVDLSNLALSYNIIGAGGTPYSNLWVYPYNTTSNGGSVFPSSPVPAFNATVVAGNLTLNAGEYRKVSILSPYELTFTTNTVTHAPYTTTDLQWIYATLALMNAANPTARLEYVNLPNYTVLSTGVLGPDTAINSLASDDPYNRSKNNWTSQAPANVTWGTINTHVSTLGNSSGVNPQQDTDATGSITDVGLQFPQLKGQTGNLYGVMESVAELGFIHTGYESSTSYQGTPWRTLRLQPKSDGTATLPDWALLDLFTVPPDTSFYAHPTSASDGGKVNLNATVLPFVSGTSGAHLTRSIPIEAVLQGSGSAALSATSATVFSRSITSHSLSTANSTNPGCSYGLSHYIMPGQIAEIQGIADTGEASEKLLCDIVDHFTVRSGVFTIISVGQSIHQLPSGTIQVLGERRERRVVEITPAGTSGTSPFLRTVSIEPIQ